LSKSDVNLVPLTLATILGTGFPLIKNTESLSAATTPERVISNANIDIKVVLKGEIGFIR
jgi:hypothetical protein